MICNICNGSEWGESDGTHPNRCRNCKSVERHRALKIVCDHFGVPKPGAKILHCAPELSLANWFSAISPDGYDAVDYAPVHYKHVNVRKFDLTKDAADLPSNHYDLIVHLHVLEHIKINIAYLLHHFHRALKPDGHHVFSVPIMTQHYYDEYLGPLSKDEALKRFFQTDHVRIFGLKDIDNHLGAIVNIDKNYSLYKYASKDHIDNCNIPPNFRTGVNGSSIFVLGKNDYRLWP